MGRFKYVLVVLLVICALVIVGSALLDKDNPSTASSSPINPDWVPVYVDQEIGNLIDVTESYAELVEEVSPAVVSIITETIEYDIFRQPYPTRGAGTGIIIDPKGYIVTNYHVVEGAENITVILSNEESVSAKKWVGDSETDLAVIEIEGEDFPYAHFLEDSLGKLLIGDKVMAMGNAGGRGIASTEGTISFLGEAIQIDNGILYDLIRTSAAINPGNSGGPLVNLAGQVVGINVAINPDYENFGYAISTNTAISIVENLIKRGNVPPTWLGVSITTVTSVIQSQYDLSVDYGAFIVEVVSGSPADTAGLKEEDVIIKFGDEETNTSKALVTAIRSYEPGDKVQITFIRDDKELTTQVTLTQRPSS